MNSCLRIRRKKHKHLAYAQPLFSPGLCFKIMVLLTSNWLQKLSLWKKPNIIGFCLFLAHLLWNSASQCIVLIRIFVLCCLVQFFPQRDTYSRIWMNFHLLLLKREGCKGQTYIHRRAYTHKMALYGYFLTALTDSIQNFFALDGKTSILCSAQLQHELWRGVEVAAW